MPHHGCLTLNEGLTERAPFNGAFRHDFFFGRKIAPELKRLDNRRIIEIGLGAIVAHQFLAILDGKALEHPVRIPGRRHHQAPFAVFRKRLASRYQFFPGLGRHFRIKTGFAEHVLVVVHDNGRTLERDAPGFAIDFAIGHQRRIEAIQPFLVFGGFDDIIKRNNQVLFDQVVNVD